MKRIKIEIVFCIGLGVLIGLAIGASRNDWPGRQASAATVTIEDDKSGQNKTQVKNASPQEAAPFQGVIAPTVRESVPHWPEQRRAERGAERPLCNDRRLGFFAAGLLRSARSPNS